LSRKWCQRYRTVRRMTSHASVRWSSGRISARRRGYPSALDQSAAGASFPGKSMADRNFDVGESMRVVGRVGLEPTTKGFRFAQVSLLPGLSHRPQPNCLGAGRSWVVIGSAPHTLVSAPSSLLVAVGWLGSGLPSLTREGFPEFTRFFHRAFPHEVTI
jgi:hypothetical protein